MQNNKNGESEIKNKEGFNVVSVSKTSYSGKPTASESSWLQCYDNSKVIKVTPSSMAELIKAGHGFHLGVFDRNLLIQDAKTKEWRKSKAFIDKGIKYQNVFGIDIDHHNFTLDELLERCPIKPNIIYKTHSYTNDNKRWRIIFFAGETIKNEKVIRLINKTLTAIFLENLPEEVLAFSDMSAINPARLFYAGKEVVYVDEKSRFYSSNILSNESLITRTTKTWDTASHYASENRKRRTKIRNNRIYLTDAEWTQWELLKKEKTVDAFNLFVELANKIDSLKVETKHGKKRKQNAPTPICEPSERPINKELIEAILEQLPSYAPEGVDFLDYSDAIKYIDNLPLDKLIEQAIGIPFLSLLRDENNPSAVLYETAGGKILYHDFATQETFGVTMFLSQLLAQEWGTIFYANVETILETMGVMMDSQYRKDAKAQIDAGFELVYKIAEGKKPHVSKPIFAYGVGHVYTGLCNLLKLYVPNECLLHGRQGVVVSRSLQEIHEELLSGHFADVEKMSIKCKKRFLGKVNKLCAMGFISKLSVDELIDSAKNDVEEHRQRLLIEQELTEADYNHPNFYEFHPVTLALLKNALEVHEQLKSKGITTTNFQQKHINAVDKEKSDKVFIQNHRKYKKDEERFIKKCTSQAKKLLEKKPYFTEEELLEPILRKDEWFNGTKKDTADEIKLDKIDKTTGMRIVKANKKLGTKRKKSMFKNTRPGFLKNSDCVIYRVNELPDTLIKELKISNKINKNSSVMFKAENLKGHTLKK